MSREEFCAIKLQNYALAEEKKKKNATKNLRGVVSGKEEC